MKESKLLKVINQQGDQQERNRFMSVYITNYRRNAMYQQLSNTVFILFAFGRPLSYYWP